MLRSPLASLLSVCVVLACVAGCVPSRPEFDSWWPDVPRRDDGGTDDADVDGGEEDGETEVPPLPRETEDNDPFHGGTAEPLDAPTTIAGNIGFPAADHPDWDVFSVAGTAGAMLRVNAFPVSYGGPDLAVRILRLDDAGTVIWERDGDDPGNTSVYRDAFLPADDTYLVVVSDAANFSPSPTAWVGGAGRDYELGVSVLPPPTAIAPSLPWTWSGSIPTSGLIQAVSATPPAGMRLEALLRSGDGVHFDPWLTVYDAAAARVVAENDDGAGGFDALSAWRRPGLRWSSSSTTSSPTLGAPPHSRSSCASSTPRRRPSRTTLRKARTTSPSAPRRCRARSRRPPWRAAVSWRTATCSASPPRPARPMRSMPSVPAAPATSIRRWRSCGSSKVPDASSRRTRWPSATTARCGATSMRECS
jgi:hypothetical protein